MKKGRGSSVVDERGGIAGKDIGQYSACELAECLMLEVKVLRNLAGLT